MDKKTALVVGANGIIGRNLTQFLVDNGAWHVIASARHQLNFPSTAAFLALDLEDENDLAAKADQLKAVTHIFFNAYTEKKTPYEQAEANTRILANLVQAVEKAAPNLERVLFIQGGKAYGAHHGIYKTPAYETDLRSITPNFYYSQEDYLRTQSAGKSWSWTALRPDIVIGFTTNTPMNLSNLIAVYATLCKEEGLPMRFPGTPKAYDVLVNVTGTDVLSKSLDWAARNDQAKNEIFNITNGDVFRWSQVWPEIGKFFGVPVAEPQTFSLAEYMPGKRALWDKIVAKYGLVANTLDAMVQWGFGDFIFRVEYDAFQDVNKARRAGFQEMNGDSLKGFLQTFQELKDQRIIP